ncbi:Transcription factor tau subunit sfc3 [Elsinoe australis]|uniref:Transcription factor tau subunit sfc3 n=1 Tax=Elsinoe australis TaxID=40998 RepID=A0A2P8A1G9_9PEZI|nr:Transcription factor tau subunit sfc3 [Elsinoe australis]
MHSPTKTQTASAINELKIVRAARARGEADPREYDSAGDLHVPASYILSSSPPTSNATKSPKDSSSLFGSSPASSPPPPQESARPAKKSRVAYDSSPSAARRYVLDEAGGTGPRQPATRALPAVQPRGLDGQSKLGKWKAKLDRQRRGYRQAIVQRREVARAMPEDVERSDEVKVAPKMVPGQAVPGAIILGKRSRVEDGEWEKEMAVAKAEFRKAGRGHPGIMTGRGGANLDF